MGKGDHRRPEDIEAIQRNWPYPDKPLNVWPRDENGELIEDEEDDT